MTLDLLLAGLVVIGVLFTLVGSVGLVLLPDFYSRLHGPSKASTLGLIALLLASALYFAGVGQASWHEAVIVVFLFVAAPISSAVLAQAALRRHVASAADLSPLKSAADESQNTG